MLIRQYKSRLQESSDYFDICIIFVSFAQLSFLKNNIFLNNIFFEDQYILNIFLNVGLVD